MSTPKTHWVKADKKTMTFMGATPKLLNFFDNSQLFMTIHEFSNMWEA